MVHPEQNHPMGDTLPERLQIFLAECAIFTPQQLARINQLMSPDNQAGLAMRSRVANIYQHISETKKISLLKCFWRI